MASRVIADAPLQPLYWADTDFTMFRGGLTVERERKIELTGDVSFRWQPSPHLEWRGWSDADVFADGVGIADVELPAAVTLRLDGLLPDVDLRDPTPGEPSCDATYFEEGHLHPEPIFGTGPIHHVVCNVINGPITHLPGLLRRPGGRFAGRLVCGGGVWTLTLDRRPDLDDVVRDLRRSGGYAFTHVARLERTDGQPMSRDDVAQATHTLRLFLSLIRGRRVGAPLAVGFDTSGDASYVDWSTSRSDPWRGYFSWAPMSVPDLPQLFESLSNKVTDPFWGQVLPLAIEYYTQANDPRSIEIALSLSQVAFELLSHAVLVETHGLSNNKYKLLHADDKIAQLLALASISDALPTTLANLIAAAPSGGWSDGPHAITRLRNGFVHPTHKKPKPSSLAWLDAWKLSQHYLTLMLLWLLDYQGDYLDLLPGGATHMMDTQAVPWRTP